MTRTLQLVRAAVAAATTAAALVVAAPTVPAAAEPVGTTAAARDVPVAAAEVNLTELAARAGATAAPLADTPPLPVPDMPVPEGAAPPAEEATAADPPPGPLPKPDPPALTASFQALGDNGTRIPPDTHGAVGPSHVMTTLNSEVRVQSRSGTVLSTVTLASFWSSLSGITDVFDPRVVYDPYGSRFVTTAVAQRSSAASSVLIGVTAASDPTGTWSLYRFDADSADANWADYPSLGFNKNWVAVNVNMFTNAGSSFANAKTWAFPRSTLYSRPASFSATSFTHTGLGGTIVPAVHFSTTLDTMHLLQRWNGNSGGSGFLRLYTITGAVGSETFTTGSFVSVAAPWAGSGAGGADFAPQLGAVEKIQNNDDRMQSVVYRNSSLWAAHTVFLPATSPTRSAVQWWQVNPATAAVQQRARIEDATGAQFFAFPSIAVNTNSDVLVGYSRYSASQYASANYSFRYGTDPANTMQADTVLKAGEAKYFKTFGSGRNRWGDYSATVVDPTNDLDLWTIQEYAALPSGGTDRWSTWWGRVSPGTTVAPAMELSPPSVDFGAHATGATSAATTITVTSTGTATLTISSATFSGANPGDFSKSLDTCTGASLAPGFTCAIGVRFSPTASGDRSALLTVAGNAPSQIATLTGVGDASAPVTIWSTTSGSVVLPGGTVSGFTSDDGAGVGTVTVTFTPTAGTPTNTAATLSCTANRRSCTWTATVPLLPGAYTARARGTDLLGRMESPGPTITIFV